MARVSQVFQMRIRRDGCPLESLCHDKGTYHVNIAIMGSALGDLRSVVDHYSRLDLMVAPTSGQI